MSFFTGHYNEIARIIHDAGEQAFPPYYRRRLIDLFAGEFAAKNPQFNETRFRAACGPVGIENEELD